MPQGGYGTGLLVESNMGRPTKVEGNKLHPASLGAADIWNQASVLSLYDPDRSQTVLQNGRASSWALFEGAMLEERAKHRQNGGVGLRFLTGAVTSPTLANQLGTLLSADHYPNAKWYQYEPVARIGSRVGGQQALGGQFETVYAFDKADVILTLDSDFLIEGPGHLAYARQYASRRKVADGQRELNRLYAVESTPTLTGSNADNRLRVRPSQVEVLARAIAAGVSGGASAQLEADEQAFVDAVVKDLLAHKGTSVVVAGEYQPPAVHAIAHALNQSLGAVGATVTYAAPVEAHPVDHMASMMELAREIYDGKVDTLVIVGGNPLYDAPADAFFNENLDRVRLRVHLGQYRDETGLMSHWHVPEAHYLESWGDVRGFDGTTSIIQPLIAPLFDGHTAYEVLSSLMGQGSRSAYDIVRQYWMTQTSGVAPDQFETWWRKALNDGIVTVPAPPPAGSPAAPTPGQANLASILASPAPPAAAGGDQLEVAFRPDPCVWDGSYANNGWLQELPKPLTKLTWDNAILMSIHDADRLGLKDEAVARLTLGDRSVDGPVRVLAGHPRGSVTVYLGHGRPRGGRVATGVGFNAYTLRTSTAPWFATGASLAPTGDRWQLAVTEHHNMISAGTEPRVAGSLDDQYSRFNDTIGAGPGYVDGERDRELVKVKTLEEYIANPLVFAEGEGTGTPVTGDSEMTHPEGSEPSETRGDPLIPGSANEQILPDSFRYDGNRWGMSIDTQSCIGCNACVVACQAENNIPVVGKEQVLTGREMHWIRVDRYFEGLADNPTDATSSRCRACSARTRRAKSVCPVGATVHSDEGLNEMVYNRCVGTRYCSNNCPYKVRRFNFLAVSGFERPDSLQAGARIPNVTVRSRGVMEKCTYCVQRINTRSIAAKKQDRAIDDGEIMTACQPACPTEAIVFGDLNDAEVAGGAS